MSKGEFYQEKKVGNEWFIKQWNGNTKRWQVTVFSDASYKRCRAFSRGEDVPSSNKTIREFGEFRDELASRLKEMGI